MAFQLTDFLPITKKEVELRGWDELDVVFFTGDAYIDHPALTAAVVDAIRVVASSTDSILELGCSVGRNLAALKQNGFKDLQGIEINPEAVHLGRDVFDLKDITIHVGSIEKLISIGTPVDVIFTQSVFMHLPPSSDWIYSLVASKARKAVITTEVEYRSDQLVWRRDYRVIFEGLGMKQINLNKINKRLLQRVMIWQK